jgi:hypothetical protein
MTMLLGIIVFISSVTPLPVMLILYVITPLNSLAETRKEEKINTVESNQLIDKILFMIFDLLSVTF